MSHNNSLLHANDNNTSTPSWWTATPVCFLLIMVILTTLNGTLLYVFARNQNLRTTFNVYVVSVLLANLVETLVQMPLNLAHYLHWLSVTACPFYIYSAAVQAVVVCSHTLITLNRVWAVTAPVSYRKYHRMKVSLAVVNVHQTYDKNNGCVLLGAISGQRGHRQCKKSA
ncbi:hypothetical protein RvY_19127 [Ramazzottius varieornatus]|uniref:G-protein coupled receptors family 1 profile domain-containing protein n=1 Tax=Ramazzottius varieornatus TaxID=947166 RepID=A0A1D1W9N1_RAMVA|nr:hypothetical protein RvY_19127 [Ramazzottius varieornatus]